MPKKQIIDPKKARKATEITFQSIPVNQYQSNFKKELKTHGKERLIRIYEDMLIIREFETMLNLIKTQGAYEGLEYNHPGPAHLYRARSGRRWSSCSSLTRRFHLRLASLPW